MNNKQSHNLRILASGDPNTHLHRLTPAQILDRFGPPRRLLSTSSKIEKSQSVGVLTRVLYLTPGVFCPLATDGCRRACLGHTSGRMQFHTHAQARDTRTALFLENQDLFMKKLRAELTLLEADALQDGFTPAVRLNGSSDLAWERLYPELFAEFSTMQFYDYTKLYARVLAFLDCTFPANYHLTFSVDAHTTSKAIDLVRRGGTVAAVYWPSIPESWWDCPVIDGDKHDARFLDPTGVVVALRAKGLARVDLSGFTIRLCPRCGPDVPQLEQTSYTLDSHHRTLHRCGSCGFEVAAKWKYNASTFGSVCRITTRQVA